MYHAFEVGSAIKLPERITKLYDTNIILVIAVYWGSQILKTWYLLGVPPLGRKVFGVLQDPRSHLRPPMLGVSIVDALSFQRFRKNRLQMKFKCQIILSVLYCELIHNGCCFLSLILKVLLDFF